jgi:serine/threonine protein kinase
VRKKLHCSHVVQLLDEFEENNNKYYISEYIEMDLLKLAINHSSKHLQLKQVLDYIAQIIEILDEMHS